MADLASAAVIVDRVWTEPARYGEQRERVCKRLTITAATMGSATNKLLASAMGFTKIEECTNGQADGDDLIYCAAPSYDGTRIHLKAAGTNAPADFADTFRIVVKGWTDLQSPV